MSRSNVTSRSSLFIGRYDRLGRTMWGLVLSGSESSQALERRGGPDGSPATAGPRAACHPGAVWIERRTTWQIVGIDPATEVEA